MARAKAASILQIQSNQQYNLNIWSNRSEFTKVRQIVPNQFAYLYQKQMKLQSMIIKQRIQKADGSIRFRNYLKQQRLGKGGFAQCFTVERMQDKRIFALKIINKKNLQKPKAKQKMISQIQLHKEAKHKSICQLQRVFQDEQNVYMLLELCSNGNMFDLIKRRKRLTVAETQYFIYQLIDGLCYLHNKQIIHRDIKLGNLLINSKMELKLADFGLATKLEYPGDRKHTVCGTPNYIAPEVIMSSMCMGVSGHSYEVDIWSSGVIMYLMLIGKAPFETTRVEKTYDKIVKADFDFPDYFKNQSGKDLLRKILVVDPSKRYTFQQILSHDFMNPTNGIPKEIPTSCMVSQPKFQSKFQKFQSSEVKQSARNCSINTLRSQVDLSLDQNYFEGLPGFKKRQQKSKDIKGLLKTVYSTSSLSKSLQKLGNIGRSISPQAKTIQPIVFNNSNHSNHSNHSNQKVSLRQRIASQSSSSRQINFQMNPPKFSPYVYILQYKKQIVLSYILNTGYIGTYQQNYKLLFNRHENLYFQAQGDGQLKRLKSQSIANNENIENRRKFLHYYLDSQVQCQPFLNTGRIVYLKRTFQVKSQNIIMFKFSNNSIQVRQTGLQKDLIVTNDELVLVTLKNGMEVNRYVCSKQKYIDSPDKDLIHLYLKFKKINNQISSMKK